MYYISQFLGQGDRCAGLANRVMASIHLSILCFRLFPDIINQFQYGYFGHNIILLTSATPSSVNRVPDPYAWFSRWAFKGQASGEHQSPLHLDQFFSSSQSGGAKLLSKPLSSPQQLSHNKQLATDPVSPHPEPSDPTILRNSLFPRVHPTLGHLTMGVHELTQRA